MEPKKKTGRGGILGPVFLSDVTAVKVVLEEKVIEPKSVIRIW